jgi:hypothetical protein
MGPFELMDSNRRPISLDTLLAYYSDTGSGTGDDEIKIKDPFAAGQTRSKAPFEVWIFKS